MTKLIQKIVFLVVIFQHFATLFQLDRLLYNFPCFVFLDIWWEGPCNFVVQSYVILCNTAKNWQKSFFCQSLPRWKSKKERFNTFDAIVNHVKRIDTFQNFNSVLIWHRRTIVQIFVVVYKVLQKLQRDVSQNIVIFQMCKYIYWLEMTSWGAKNATISLCSKRWYYRYVLYKYTAVN